jgi:hypothetical protein
MRCAADAGERDGFFAECAALTLTIDLQDGYARRMPTDIVMGFDEYFDNLAGGRTCHIHFYYLSYH